jgi:hypothetical protein
MRATIGATIVCERRERHVMKPARPRRVKSNAAAHSVFESRHEALVPHTTQRDDAYTRRHRSRHARVVTTLSRRAAKRISH